MVLVALTVGLATDTLAAVFGLLFSFCAAAETALAERAQMRMRYADPALRGIRCAGDRAHR